MLRSSRGRDFAQNFEPDLSGGVPPPQSQLFNALTKHPKSIESTQKSRNMLFFMHIFAPARQPDNKLTSLGHCVAIPGSLCVGRGDWRTQRGWSCPRTVARPPGTVCLPRRDTVRLPQRHCVSVAQRQCVVPIQQIYSVYTADR